MSGIFISHAHSDEAFAHAIAELIGELFDDRVSVSYSSKRELEGGIRPGENWFHWIAAKVREADVAFVLLTRASIQSTWVIWESGAVTGVSLANSRDEASVFPIIFDLEASEVPPPLRHIQVLIGTIRSDVLKLINDLFERLVK